MLEVELKSVVDNLDVRRRAVEQAGGVLRFAGRLEDRRYDTEERTLRMRDHVLRLRVQADASRTRATLDWKGPTYERDGYKVREEVVVAVDDPSGVAALLDRLGYVVTQAIDRDVWEYELLGASIRFERYPHMDPLVEVEGAPSAIERAVAAIGLPRDGFTSERLADFVRRFEARTGSRAALSHTDLAGVDSYDVADA